MAQNGLGEIKAVEDRLHLAKKAKARSSQSLQFARSATEAARKIYEDAQRALNSAIADDQEAENDLNEAVEAVRVVNKKWELIEIDCEVDDDWNRSDKKRAVSSSSSEEGEQQQHEPKSKKTKNTVSISDVKSINVTGSGTPDANGIYKRLEPQNKNRISRNQSSNQSVESPVFKNKSGYRIFNRRGRGVPDCWYIISGSCLMYECCIQGSRCNDPLGSVWVVSPGGGSKPPPRLEVKEFLK